MEEIKNPGQNLDIFSFYKTHYFTYGTQRVGMILSSVLQFNVLSAFRDRHILTISGWPKTGACLDVTTSVERETH